MFKRFNPMLSAIKVTHAAIGVYVPITCKQCEEAPCAKVCPTEAITLDRETGAYKINIARCIKCRLCVSACPIGAISFTPEGDLVLCDLCGGDPLCVKHCPTGALKYDISEKAILTTRLKKAREIAKSLIEEV
jgi:Fe-S-cluster-containing hydrogenase component 2